MALKAQIDLSKASDCSEFYFFDKTGVYDATDNPGGFGSPNPNLVHVTACTIALLYAGATTPVVFDPYVGTPGVGLPTNDPALAYLLTPAMFGLSSWPEGVTTIVYTISGVFGGSPFTTKASISFVVDCELRCCIDEKNLAAAKTVTNGSCGCASDTTLTTMFLSTVLDAAEAAACCGNVTEADKLFNYVKSKCSGCGC